MTSATAKHHHAKHDEVLRPNLDAKPSLITAIIFIGLLVAGLIYTAFSISHDVQATNHGQSVTNWTPFILLGIALLIALGFEFVNGFHDTANAVATVIYTNSMPPNVAVIWSGFFNFLGVLLSSGLVAFGIITSWVFSRLCHGICIINCSDYLELRNMVVRIACFIIPYTYRIYYWCWCC